MNIALIMAGGTGNRTGNKIPKQFVTINGKPVIIHTLQAFQNHPAIDAICVVCLDGWHEILAKYAQQYNITKLKHITSGGATNHESIYKGLTKLSAHYSADDIVLIHDAVRPLVSADIISDNIRTVITKGNAITCIPCTEAILQSQDGISANKSIPRETLQRTQTPQGFKLHDILAAHKRAQALNMPPSTASCTLMASLGLPVHISVGAERNIKITNDEDFELVSVLLSFAEKKLTIANDASTISTDKLR